MQKNQIKQIYLPSPDQINVPWEKESSTSAIALSFESGFDSIFLDYHRISLPPSLFDFVQEQFYHFVASKNNSFSMPDEKMVMGCWETCLFYLDVYDPFLLFQGVTDVILTDKPNYYQFSYYNDQEKAWIDINPDTGIDHFEYFPKGAESATILYNNPGLNNTHFSGLYEFLEEQWGENCHERGSLQNDFKKEYGDRAFDILHLISWACVVWMIGPGKNSRFWREYNHPVFSHIYDGDNIANREVLLTEYSMLTEKEFKMHERAPLSCAICGIKNQLSNCITLEDNNNSGVYYYVCQHCLSDGEPFPGRTCGTLYCTYVSCKHHPAHNLDRGAQLASMRQIAADKRFGQLRQLENGMYTRDLPGLIMINHVAIQQNVKSIASDFERVLLGLLNKE